MLVNERTGENDAEREDMVSLDSYNTAICTDKVLLVPYCHHHVTTYHDWMKDPDIQVATASDPLTIDQEYAMQESWRADADKLTFILCLAPSNDTGVPKRVVEIASMIGDVNMFLSLHEEEDETMSLVGELELMIASKDFRRKGLGRAALLVFVYYVLQHEAKIVKEFLGLNTLASDTQSVGYFTAKINEANGRSLSLFEALGFEKTSSVPSYFGEYELRHYSLTTDTVSSMLSQHGIEGYREVEYE